MKKMMKMLMGVSCALLAGTVMAEDNAEPAWLLITPQVTMRPNKYGDDVPEITGYLTNGYYQVRNAVQDAKSGSTILLVCDRSSDVGESSVFIQEDKVVTIDLNGHSLSPGTIKGMAHNLPESQQCRAEHRERQHFGRSAILHPR